MSLDLNKLENKLDKALSNETSESLNKFLTDKRMTQETTQTELLISKPIQDKLNHLHTQLEKFFGVSREEYLNSASNNMINVKYIGCYVGMTIEKINPTTVAFDFKRDRTTMYHVMSKVEGWVDFPHMYAEESGLLNSFLDFYKGHTTTELRVYLVDDEDDDEMTDQEFILNAEATGKVYSLAGFQEAYNNREFVFTQYSIRILNVGE